MLHRKIKSTALLLLTAVITLGACAMQKDQPNSDETSTLAADTTVQGIAIGVILTLKQDPRLLDEQIILEGLATDRNSFAQMMFEKGGVQLAEGEPLKGKFRTLVRCDGAESPSCAESLKQLRSLPEVRSAAFVFANAKANLSSFKGYAAYRMIDIQLTATAMQQYSRELTTINQAYNTSIYKSLRKAGMVTYLGSRFGGLVLGALPGMRDLQSTRQLAGKVTALNFVETLEFDRSTDIGGGVTGSN